MKTDRSGREVVDNDNNAQQVEGGAHRRPRRTSIPCPKCGHAKSFSTGGVKATNERVWRRRVCAACRKRFTSYEITADDYARLVRIKDVEAHRMRVKELEDALTAVFEMVKRDHARAEEDRTWQRENPTTAIEAILPPPVAEYLRMKAYRKGKTLTALLIEEMTFCVEIDIECSADDMSESEADEWLAKLEPFTNKNGP